MTAVLAADAPGPLGAVSVGQKGRDNIDSADLVSAFGFVAEAPRLGASYNVGGGRQVNCSMVEAVALCERIAGRSLPWAYAGVHRLRDQVWYIRDPPVSRCDYPSWAPRHGRESILGDLCECNANRWGATAS